MISSSILTDKTILKDEILNIMIAGRDTVRFLKLHIYTGLSLMAMDRPLQH